MGLGHELAKASRGERYTQELGDAVDRKLRAQFQNEATRGDAIKAARRIPGMDSLTDDDIFAAATVEEPKPLPTQTPVAAMKEIRRGRSAMDALAGQMAAQTDTELKDTSDGRPAGRGPPSRLAATLQDVSLSPDEIDLSITRPKRTFLSNDEAQGIVNEAPDKREIVTDGIHVWVVDRSNGRMVAQGRDDFVSYNPATVKFAAESKLGKAGQAVLGAIGGSGDPLQQVAAGLLRNKSSVFDQPSEKDQGPLANMLGFGLPELGKQAGEELAQQRDLSGMADPAVKGVGAISKVIGKLGEGWDYLSRPNAFNPVGLAQPVEKSPYSEAGDKLLEGVPNLAAGQKLDPEMNEELGVELMRLPAAAAQMKAPTSGVELIRHGIAPAVKGGSDAFRAAVGRAIDKSGDRGGRFRGLSNTPSAFAHPDEVVRARLHGAEQIGRSAGDTMSQDLFAHIKGKVPGLSDEAMDDLIKNWDDVPRRQEAMKKYGAAGAAAESEVENLNREVWRQFVDTPFNSLMKTKGLAGVPEEAALAELRRSTQFPDLASTRFENPVFAQLEKSGALDPISKRLSEPGPVTLDDIEALYPGPKFQRTRINYGQAVTDAPDPTHGAVEMEKNAADARRAATEAMDKIPESKAWQKSIAGETSVLRSGLSKQRAMDARNASRWSDTGEARVKYGYEPEFPTARDEMVPGVQRERLENMRAEAPPSPKELTKIAEKKAIEAERLRGKSEALRTILGDEPVVAGQGRWDEVKRAVVKKSDESLDKTARETDLLDEELEATNALTGSVKTARAEFLRSGGPWRKQARYLMDGIETEPVSKYASEFSGGDKDVTELLVSAPPEQLSPMFLKKGKALVRIGQAPVSTPKTSGVIYLPSTGDKALDASLHNSVMDRRVAQAMYQMSDPQLEAKAAEAFAKEADRWLATSVTTQGLTRGRPGFGMFQRFSEWMRVFSSNPEFAGSTRRDVAKAFTGSTEPIVPGGISYKDLYDAMRQRGSLGYGTTQEILDMRGSPEFFFGEGFVHKRGGAANTVYKGMRKAREIAMYPGDASNALAEAAWRTEFKGLPKDVAAEDAIKMWAAINEIKAGSDPDVAVQYVTDLLVNFSARTPAQIRAKPLIPFVKWTTASAQSAMKLALRRPDSYRNLINFMRAVETADSSAHGDKPLDARIKEPAWNAMGVPALQIGDQVYRGQLPTPWVELGDVVDQGVNTVRSAFGGDQSGPGITSQLAPRIHQAFRLGTGTDMSRGRAYGLADSAVAQNATKAPYSTGIPGGLGQLADAYTAQKADPANHPPAALLGENPEAAMAIEYLSLLFPDIFPQYALDMARAGVGRVSPTRLDPEASESYRLRKGVQYGTGVPLYPVDANTVSKSRGSQVRRQMWKNPEAVLLQELLRGSVPE